MIDLRDLEQKIQDRLAVAEQRHRRHEDHYRQRHAAREQRARQFRALADRLVRLHIRPRLDRLAVHFSGAVPLHAEEQGRNRCVYVFQPRAGFRAGGILEMAVHHDVEVERLFLLYRLDLLPAPFPFVSHDRLVLPLLGADEDRAAAWIEERLLEALDVCLRLRSGEAEPPAPPLAA